MWADIMAYACGRDMGLLQAIPAWLRDHARHPVVGEDYPGLVAHAGSGPVHGVLYTGLEPPELERLDAFEGDEYERVMVTVEVGGQAGSTSLRAWVYRFRSEFASRLGAGPWSVQEFDVRGKARFCERHLSRVRSHRR